MREQTSIFVTTLILSIALARTAAAAQGDCGQPVTSGATPTASDALFVLRVAVGAESCELCVCDVDRTGSIAASDALATLKRAVGQSVGNDCLACLVEAVIGPDGGDITSADGVVTVEFPAGALAAETTVSIEGIQPSELPSPAAEAEDVGSYELGPDGLVLAAPATVSATFSQDLGPANSEIAIILSSDGSTLEAAANQGLFMDEDTGSRVASAELTHFSLLAVIPTGVKIAVLDVPDDAAINDVQAITVEVRSDDDSLTVTSASYTDDDFGVWQPASGSAIVADELTSVSETDYSEAFDYQCTGTASVFYRPAIDIVYDVDAGPFQVTGIAHTTIFQKTIDCHP